MALCISINYFDEHNKSFIHHLVIWPC